MHESVTADELAAQLVTHGIPTDYAAVLAGLDDLVRSGAQARVTDVVERLTGHPPRPLRAVPAEDLLSRRRGRRGRRGRR